MEKDYDKHYSPGDDDTSYVPSVPPTPNVHKELPPLPVTSASSTPPATPLAQSNFLSVPPRYAAPTPGHAVTTLPRSSDNLSPLVNASPLVSILTNQSLAEDPHLKWADAEDSSMPLGGTTICPTPLDLPIQSPFSTPSFSHPQSPEDSHLSPPLLTTPIPRVSSFLDFWADSDERLKRNAVTENSDLVERWFEASDVLTSIASGDGGERVVFQDGGHEGDWDGDQDEHNRALVLGIAFNVVKDFLRKWGAGTRREVEDSASLNPPSFDLARFIRDDVARQLDEGEQRGVEYAEGVGRDLIQGEASLREALTVARNLDLEGDAHRLLRGVLKVLEELLSPNVRSSEIQGNWLCTELGLLFERDSGNPSRVHAEQRDRRQWLREATVAALGKCGEDREDSSWGVWEAYALIKREMERVEERH